MKFDDQRLLGVRLGSVIVTEENQYLVIKKKDHYALLNIHDLECTHVEVQLENIEELLRKMLYRERSWNNSFFLFIIRITFLTRHQ
ncbi:hypothetical protein LAE98_02420 [Bacillus wiedmannii]|uniref:hypothetical protein n=1 Tax=Bacillus wiedmannii TaxID=1890302 RepID=UPI001CBD8D83|nr:hypothetical protein [Bacillus wiedmannii]MBZ4220987.1 hypothetical protein [Bacillus wiedmannii]